MTTMASGLSILSRGVMSVAMLAMAVAVVGNGLDRQTENDPAYGAWCQIGFLSMRSFLARHPALLKSALIR
jgi:hypothetical protein